MSRIERVKSGDRARRLAGQQYGVIGESFSSTCELPEDVVPRSIESIWLLNLCTIGTSFVAASSVSVTQNCIAVLLISNLHLESIAAQSKESVLVRFRLVCHMLSAAEDQ